MAANGIITTVVGNGSAGYAGDGGQATEAQLNKPMGVAVDNNYNLYIAEYGNYRIRKVATDGIITTVAGNGSAGYAGDGGPAIIAQLSPSGVALDSCDNLYIADFSNERVRFINDWRRGLIPESIKPAMQFINQFWILKQHTHLCTPKNPGIGQVG